MSVCIVIVTWNRLNLLKTCIDAARVNAVEADILVVDNASTDGTAEWLRTQEDVRVLSLPKNIGGAGGFAEGMKFARERGYEWLWVMDDDVVPLPGGLRALLEYSKRYDAVQPTKLDSKGRVWEFEGLLDVRSLRRSNIEHKRAFAVADAVPCNAACFEGLFFKSALIGRTGLPFADFFITWDDIYYGLLLSRVTQFVYVKTPCIQKQIDKERLCVCGKRLYSSSSLSRFYHLRNFCRVIRMERLGWRAWRRFCFEWCKAVFLTACLEFDLRGTFRLMKVVGT